MSEGTPSGGKEFNYKKIAASSQAEKPHAVSCPICENVCSAHAAACPRCGHPINAPAQETKSDSSRTALRILWVLFILSLLFSFTAIGVYNNMLYDTGGPFVRAGRQADMIGIAVRIALPIIFGFVLVLVYAVRGRR